MEYAQTTTSRQRELIQRDYDLIHRNDSDEEPETDEERVSDMEDDEANDGDGANRELLYLDDRQGRMTPPPTYEEAMAAGKDTEMQHDK